MNRIYLSDSSIAAFVEGAWDDSELVFVGLGETRETPPHHIGAPDLEVVAEIAVSGEGELLPLSRAPTGLQQVCGRTCCDVGHSRSGQEGADH